MILVRGAKKAYRRLRLVKKRYEAVYTAKDTPTVEKSRTVDLRRQGFSLQASFCCELRYNDYRDYISTWESWQPRKSDSPYFRISDDKYLFACVFGPHIAVPPTYALIEDGKVIGVDPAGLDQDGLYPFLLRQGGGVIKDRYGSGGYRVYPLSAADGGLRYQGRTVTREELGRIVKNFRGGIIQGLLTQGQFENSIFDKSVNTVRVLSSRRPDSPEHEVIGAVHRFGSQRSAPVDNFDQGGLCALIDIDTGRLGKATGMYETTPDDRHVFYDRHPSSGAQIEGRVVPDWEALKERIAALTRALPFFEFVAWDFVIQDDGFALVEINMKSGLNCFQIHGGVRHKLLGEKYREHGYLVEAWDRAGAPRKGAKGTGAG